MKLYDYSRSSASYRVRIACNLKGLRPEVVATDLRQNQQRSSGYLAINPSGLAPALALDDGVVLSQSLAIIRYLDHLAPEPRLFPEDPLLEARALEMASIIACDIHPLNNLRVLKYLENVLDADDGQRNAWYANWVRLGFEGLEARAAGGEGPYLLGREVTVADVCLVPQVYNARRFAVPLDEFPRLVEIDARLGQLDAFREAAPPVPPTAL